MAKSKVVKRAYKLLAECKDPRVRNAILQRAPERSVKTICNAVLNVERGDIALNKDRSKCLISIERPSLS